MVNLVSKNVKMLIVSKIIWWIYCSAFIYGDISFHIAIGKYETNFEQILTECFRNAALYQSLLSPTNTKHNKRKTWLVCFLSYEWLPLQTQYNMHTKMCAVCSKNNTTYFIG